MNDEVKVEMYSKAENEALARVVIAAFMTRLNPTLEERSDVKTAVSEAVTNSIVHGYGDEMGKIILEGKIDGDLLQVSIVDSGIGIENVKRAREPLFTTKPEEERSGMGFTFMEVFMDDLKVFSDRDKGTTIVMKKTFGVNAD